MRLPNYKRHTRVNKNACKNWYDNGPYFSQRFTGKISKNLKTAIPANCCKNIMSKIFSSIAVSLDGYIGSKSGDVSWLNDTMVQGEDYGFEETMNRTGIYVMGANTYKEMLKSGMVGGKERTYVITKEKDLKKGTRTQFFDGDLKELADKVKSETDKDIYIWGGGNVITQFIDLDLLDELIIAVIPILLGDGVPLFGKFGKLKKLTLTECKKFEKSGVVLLRYEL